MVLGEIPGARKRGIVHGNAGSIVGARMETGHTPRRIFPGDPAVPAPRHLAVQRIRTALTRHRPRRSTSRAATAKRRRPRSYPAKTSAPSPVRTTRTVTRVAAPSRRSRDAVRARVSTAASTVDSATARNWPSGRRPSTTSRIRRSDRSANCAASASPSRVGALPGVTAPPPALFSSPARTAPPSRSSAPATTRTPDRDPGERPLCGDLRAVRIPAAGLGTRRRGAVILPSSSGGSQFGAYCEGQRMFTGLSEDSSIRHSPCRPASGIDRISMPRPTDTGRVFLDRRDKYHSSVRRWVGSHHNGDGETGREYRTA